MAPIHSLHFPLLYCALKILQLIFSISSHLLLISHIIFIFIEPNCKGKEGIFLRQINKRRIGDEYVHNKLGRNTPAAIDLSFHGTKINENTLFYSLNPLLGHGQRMNSPLLPKKVNSSLPKLGISLEGFDSPHQSESIYFIYSNMSSMPPLSLPRRLIPGNLLAPSPHFMAICVILAGKVGEKGEENDHLDWSEH